MQTAPKDALRTPRDLRLELNKMERWYLRHAALFGAEGVRIRAFFEVAQTADHVDFLAHELRQAYARLNEGVGSGN